MKNSQSTPPVGSSRHRIKHVLIVGLCALMVIVFVYSRLDAWRNRERLRDVQTITDAVHQYVADHRGTYPPGLDSTERQIGRASFGCHLRTPQCSIDEGSDCLDLTVSLRPYLWNIPDDPGWAGNAWWTHYAIRKERNGSFIVIPCEYSQ